MNYSITLVKLLFFFRVFSCNIRFTLFFFRFWTFLVSVFDNWKNADVRGAYLPLHQPRRGYILRRGYSSTRLKPKPRDPGNMQITRREHRWRVYTLLSIICSNVWIAKVDNYWFWQTSFTVQVMRLWIMGRSADRRIFRLKTWKLLGTSFGFARCIRDAALVCCIDWTRRGVLVSVGSAVSLSLSDCRLYYAAWPAGLPFARPPGHPSALPPTKL